MKNIIYIFLLFFTFTSYSQLGNFGSSGDDNLELKVFERGLEQSLFLDKASVKLGDTFEVLLDLKMKRRLVRLLAGLWRYFSKNGFCLGNS